MITKADNENIKAFLEFPILNKLSYSEMIDFNLHLSHKFEEELNSLSNLEIIMQKNNINLK